MNKGVELFQALGMIPHQGAELAAVDVPVRIEDARAELPDDGVVRFGARQHYFVAELVGFDEIATQVSQRVAHETFARRQTAGQSYAEHWPTRSISLMWSISPMR